VNPVTANGYCRGSSGTFLPAFVAFMPSGAYRSWFQPGGRDQLATADHWVYLYNQTTVASVMPGFGDDP
jgi:hypothetical protein